MKTITILCLALLVVLLPGVVEAQAKPDKTADAALAKLAAEKRGAALKFSWKGGEGATMYALGAFVSKDGLALVALEAVTTNQVPTVLTAEGKSLKFGKILKLFPEQGSALMKFDHKPKVIVSVGKKEPEIGDTIALIPWDPEAPGFGRISPVVGDIMVKRRDISTALKEPKFLKVLSLGSAISREQQEGLTSSFAINANGNLVARFLGFKPYPNQTLITLFPVVDIAGKTGPLAKGEKNLKHPLLAAVNPVDPATLDPDYARAMAALTQRDMVTGRRLLKALMERHPNNLILQGNAVNLMTLDPKGQDPLIELKDVPSPDPNDSKARRYLIHTMRSAILLVQGESPHLELLGAIKCSPKDCMDAKGNLAGLCLQIDPPLLAEAAGLYGEIYPYFSDTIHLVEKYEKVLKKLGKDEEARKVSKRYRELLTIYSRMRGR